MLEMHLNVGKRDGRAGYFIEELTNEQFISYAELSTLAGVSVGVLHNEGQGWLRFDYEGTELIVSKKTIRHTISWNQINNAGCVFGTKEITVNGSRYKVRLLTGADFSPFTNITGSYLDGTHNSEWSRLFYPLVTDDSTLNSQYTGPKDPRYMSLQLGIVTEYGSYSWCQETHLYGSAYRVVRGYVGVSGLLRYTSSSTGTIHGWRPCLELIQSHEAPEIQVASYHNPEVFEMAPSNLHHTYYSDPNTL